MINTRKASSFSIFTIYMLWIAAVFDPIGMVWGARYVALVLVSLVLLIRLLRQDIVLRVNDFYFWVFCFFVFVLPGYGLAIGLLRGGFGAEFIDTSYIAAAVIFGYSLIYLNNDLIKVGLKAQTLALRLLSLAIVFSLILCVLSLPLEFVYFFVTNGVAYFGERTYGGVNFYYIYFIASPMIIFLVVYEAWKFYDKPSWSGAIFLTLPIVALFVSGTRFNMLMAVFGAPMVFLWRKFRWVSIIAGLLMAVTLYIGSNTFDNKVIESMLDSKDVSTSQKIGYLDKYSDIFSDPATILFGQGFNAHAWSEILSGMITAEDGTRASKTELTYIEFFRVFGVFIGSMFIFILIFMIQRLDKCDTSYRWLGIATFFYLIVSSTNPYIFSTNGMLPLGLCAAILQRYRV